jgi:epoxyqueuosine reductase
VPSTRQIKERARRLGFDRVGIARVEALGPEGLRLRAWLEAGRAGEMRYMERSAATRIDPRRPGMLPSARSIVVLAAAITRPPEPEGPAPGRIARYARGRDYHNVLGKRAKRLARWLRTLGHEARSATDQMPIFERAWAERAGLGFVGKNCCLIVPGLGSHVLLASVLTSAELETDAPGEPRCGTCRLCLDACPTGAFTGPGELDARRCISYLTIEQAGPVPEELRTAIGDRLFGCDDCQDICPWTRVPTPSVEATLPFATDPRWSGLGAADLLALDEAGFLRLTEATPLRRPGRAGLARNAALVLGNAGDHVHLPVLQRAATLDPSPVVRDAAAWAAGKLGATRARSKFPSSTGPAATGGACGGSGRPCTSR